MPVILMRIAMLGSAVFLGKSLINKTPDIIKGALQDENGEDWKDLLIGVIKIPVIVFCAIWIFERVIEKRLVKK